MNEDTGEVREYSKIPENERKNWSDSFHKGDIVEVKGLKFKISDWRSNGRLFLKLVKGGRRSHAEKNLEKCEDCGKLAMKEIVMDMLECVKCGINYPLEDGKDTCGNCGEMEFRDIKDHKYRECQACGECRPTNVHGGCQCGCQNLTAEEEESKNYADQAAREDHERDLRSR